MILLILILFQTDQELLSEKQEAGSKSWYDIEELQIRKQDLPFKDKKESQFTPNIRKPVTNSFLDFGAFAIVLLLAIGVALLLYVLLVILGKAPPVELQSSSQSKGPTLRKHLLPEPMQAEGDLLTLAREARKKGDYPKAFAYLFGFFLVQCDAYHLIRLHPAKTNRMFLRELKTKNLNPLFHQLMVAFESHYFGPNPKDDDGWVQLFKAVQQTAWPQGEDHG